ncbi:hypothetical protein [Sporosarcina ureae]|nr:hypothetical protein [Sporosarcina ureae]
MRGNEIKCYFRDAKLLEIREDTLEVRRVVIARQLGG